MRAGLQPRLVSRDCRSRAVVGRWCWNRKQRFVDHLECHKDVCLVKKDLD